jgi:hypothetical protein
VDRREFAGSLALGILAAPLVAEAQPAGKVYRLGYLAPNSRNSRQEPSFQTLRDLGYIEGRTW